MSNGKERIQLNLRLDGHKDLYEAVKVAASEQDTSVNQFVIDALKAALGWEAEAAVSPQIVSEIESRLALLESHLALVSSIENRLDEVEQQLGESIA
ncbi:toxin-antitoxin system HicB family antitoxin [Coleofasciculus sp. FACHB-SPT9]|uniref:toxin-antitoxin system HicB family antitoxin n=1 Tax=Cyanophyceae TaxID=3028117 RepID=UPI0016864CA3|nr:toxin-antitoxin system HicB family antitoxin [Coleofasciculus sp. FACHB-SPT9]MBD1889319.1 toxin-antitoxin system HicB family antitoxin [Coleofasciculus sp. FACHB-SPT9]